jgi:hypothetical protein
VYCAETHPFLKPSITPHPQLFILRKFIEAELAEIQLSSDDVYFCSLSSATVVYKGQLTPEQVRRTACVRAAVGGCMRGLLRSLHFWTLEQVRGVDQLYHCVEN